jgi:trk system potassium uptake protein
MLMLPIASAPGRVNTFLDALFTATSAVTVTGLVLVDTGTHWSGFGQAVLAILIQLGGFGFITGTTLVLMAIGGRLGLRDKLFISESAGADGIEGVRGLIFKIAIFSLLIEAIGATLLFIRWRVTGAADISLWTAIFQAASAFNNCGMDILGNFKGLIIYQADAPVLLITALLVILGSTGYIVILDLFQRRRFSSLTLDSKIVVTTTLSLLVLGTLFYLATEFSRPGTLGPLSGPQKLVAAFFQAVVPRTAGFSAIDIGSLSQLALFFTMFLMFVGGASGSTAGGLKVNTLGVLVITLISVIKGNSNVSAFGRQVNTQTIFRAITLTIFYLMVVCLVVLALSITEVFPLEKIIFESFSALGTVGLSTGITPGLSTPGQFIVIIAMFAGRLAPLTFMALLSRRHHPTIIDYPREGIIMG